MQITRTLSYRSRMVGALMYCLGAPPTLMVNKGYRLVLKRAIPKIQTDKGFLSRRFAFRIQVLSVSGLLRYLKKTIQLLFRTPLAKRPHSLCLIRPPSAEFRRLTGRAI